MTYYFSYPSAARRTRQSMQRTMDPEWQQQEYNVTFPIDVKAEEDAYVITALIPGIKAEDLNIQIVNETLSIQGELVNDREEDARYLLAERPFGKFCRTLTLPEQLDSSKSEAEFENGVLKLRIPKAEQAKPKSIKVISKK